MLLAWAGHDAAIFEHTERPAIVGVIVVAQKCR